MHLVCADGATIVTNRIYISIRSKFLKKTLRDDHIDDDITTIILPNVTNSAVLETILRLPHGAAFDEKELQDYRDILDMLDIASDYYDTDKMEDDDDDGGGYENRICLASFRSNRDDDGISDYDDFEVGSSDGSFTLAGILDDSNDDNDEKPKENSETKKPESENKSEMNDELLQSLGLTPVTKKARKRKSQDNKERENKSRRTQEWVRNGLKSSANNQKLKGAADYPCMFCSHSAMSFANLKSHISGVHFAQELLQDGGCEDGKVCAICDKMFGQPSFLVRHLGCTHDMLPADVKEKLKKFRKRPARQTKEQELAIR